MSKEVNVITPNVIGQAIRSDLLRGNGLRIIQVVLIADGRNIKAYRTNQHHLGVIEAGLSAMINPVILLDKICQCDEVEP